jgi:hypothetical protein
LALDDVDIESATAATARAGLAIVLILDLSHVSIHTRVEKALNGLSTSSVEVKVSRDVISESDKVVRVENGTITAGRHSVVKA